MTQEDFKSHTMLLQHTVKLESNSFDKSFKDNLMDKIMSNLQILRQERSCYRDLMWKY